MPIEGWVMPLSQREMNEISIPERYANSSCVSPSSTRRRFNSRPKILAALDIFIWRGMDTIVQVFACRVQSIYALYFTTLKALRSEGRGATHLAWWSRVRKLHRQNSRSTGGVPSWTTQ